MSFEVVKFSQDGLGLLASISSSKSLRIKNIYIDEDAHSDTDVEQSPNWWSSQTSSTRLKANAKLTSAGTVGAQARLVLALSIKQGIINPPSQMTIKSIVITACGVEGGVETSEITFCGVFDSNGVQLLYNAAVPTSSSVTLYFKFSEASSITVDTGLQPDYVLHSELDRLVSCHKVGDVTTGEAQTILGVKTFSDGAVVDVASAKKLKLKDGNDDLGYISNNGTINGYALVATCDDESDNPSYFTFAYEQSGGYEYLVQMYRSFDDGEDEIVISPRLMATTINTWNLGSGTYPNIELNTNMEPGIGDYYSLGASDRRFDEVFSKQFIGDTFTSNDVNGTVSITGAGLGIVQSATLNRYQLEFARTTTGSLTQKAVFSWNYHDNANWLTCTVKGRDVVEINDDTVYMQPNNGIFCDCNVTCEADFHCNGDMYGNLQGNLYGLIPYPSSETNIPVGCIFILKGDLEVTRGIKIKRTANGWALDNTAQTAISLQFGDLETPTVNKYLNAGNFNSSTRFVALSHADAGKCFLAIRTA